MLLLGLTLLFLGCLSRAGGNQGVAPASTASHDCTFANPIADGADPWVVQNDGLYHLIESTGEAIRVYRSRELTDLKKHGVTIWQAPDRGWNQSHVWAPELHLINGRWYVYYAAGQSGPPFIHQRSGVLQSETIDPQGAYVDRGQLYTGDDVETGTENTWSIDLTVARVDGQLYAVWSGWEENRPDDDTSQHLYIATMSDPWTVSSDRVRISSPVRPWERSTELDLNEGPTFLKRDGAVFIIYSARESWLPAYRLGQLRLARQGADPLSPDSWIKRGPVFTGTDEVHGVGHASFTTSPDDTENWIVYHTKKSTEPGWERAIMTQPFQWGEDGAPMFGEPVPSGEVIAVPSGQGGCEEGTLTTKP